MVSRSPQLLIMRDVFCAVGTVIAFIEQCRVCEPRFVTVKGSCVVGDGSQGLICIYAPNELSEKEVFFQNLIYFVQN